MVFSCTDKALTLNLEGESSVEAQHQLQKTAWSPAVEAVNTRTRGGLATRAVGKGICLELHIHSAHAGSHSESSHSGRH